MINEIFLVTEAAQRPARMDGSCFYCHQEIGQEHQEDCVMVSKKVKMKATIEFEATYPASWNKEQIEEYRNESSWCADNFIFELDRLADQLTEEGECLCGHVEFECIDDTGTPFLEEG